MGIYSISTDGYVTDSFEVKEPRATTSIAFILTQMKPQTSLDTRVSVYHPNEAAGKLLLNYYHELFLAIEQELNMVSVFNKISIIYAPSLEITPVLAKWGLIYVNPQMLPIENSQLHSVELRNIKKEAARSIYQMFFGQYVTPVWWNDQWITNGLARYLSGVSSHLPFDAEREFVSDTVQMVIRDYNSFSGQIMGALWYNSAQINRPNLFVVDHRGK